MRCSRECDRYFEFILLQIEAALFECVCRLNCTRKLRVMPKLPVKLPESWRVNLASHVSRDILSATVSFFNFIRLLYVSFQATLFAEDLASLFDIIK